MKLQTADSEIRIKQHSRRKSENANQVTLYIFRKVQFIPILLYCSALF